MSRRRHERRKLAFEKWPLLANLLTCHFNEDFKVFHSDLNSAFAAAAGEGSLDHRRSVLKEWRDWNSTAGATDDVRPLLDDGFGVAVYFKNAIEARNFMNRLYDELLVRVKAEAEGR